MTALDLFQEVPVLGVMLTPYPDGTLCYKAPKDTMTPELVGAMRQQKAALHALVEEWSERAAIAEYCGGLSRPEAERLAWQCVLGPGDLDDDGPPSGLRRVLAEARQYRQSIDLGS